MPDIIIVLQRLHEAQRSSPTPENPVPISLPRNSNVVQRYLYCGVPSLLQSVLTLFSQLPSSRLSSIVASSLLSNPISPIRPLTTSKPSLTDLKRSSNLAFLAAHTLHSRGTLYVVHGCAVGMHSTLIALLLLEGREDMGDEAVDVDADNGEKSLYRRVLEGDADPAFSSASVQ